MRNTGDALRGAPKPKLALVLALFSMAAMAHIGQGDVGGGFLAGVHHPLGGSTM